MRVERARRGAARDHDVGKQRRELVHDAGGVLVREYTEQQRPYGRLYGGVGGFTVHGHPIESGTTRRGERLEAGGQLFCKHGGGLGVVRRVDDEKRVFAQALEAPGDGKAEKRARGLRQRGDRDPEKRLCRLQRRRNVGALVGRKRRDGVRVGEQP